MERLTQNGLEELQSRHGAEKPRRDWKKISIYTLAVIGALFLLGRLFYCEKGSKVELDYGGATFISYSWWGLRSERYPLRYMKTDHYGEWLDYWCIKVKGEWVPLELEAAPED